LSQRTSEWIEAVDLGYLEYHRRQFETPYRSTIAFSKWLRTLGLPAPNTRIADIGCGMGAALNYLAGEAPNTVFRGIEISERLVHLGRKLIDKSNVSLLVGDLYQLDLTHKNSYDGIISLQTLSWLPNFQQPLKAMCTLNPNWIALSSLFYDGPVSCNIEVQDYTQPLKSQPYKQEFYNI
jgi:SAM-dependent methyltransferase